MLKNIAGLWVLQECRSAWALEGSDYTYDELAQMASRGAAVCGRDSPDAFLGAGSHAGEDRGLLPADRAGGRRRHRSTCRTILESLALRYRQVLESSKC